MSPKGQIPAYEWAFGDVNPPLHAWAALQLHRIEMEEHQKAGKSNFKGDLSFLSDIFQHCLMNFTWWSNQQDSENNNLFEGGFLGLDNISILNRRDLNSFADSIGAKSVVLSQSDGTSWVGMFCLNMMEIANVLTAVDAETYSHLSNKFLQYFFDISGSINGDEDGSNAGRGRANLWDCLLYTSPSPRDATLSRMPSSA